MECNMTRSSVTPGTQLKNKPALLQEMAWSPIGVMPKLAAKLISSSLRIVFNKWLFYVEHIGKSNLGKGSEIFEIACK